MIYNGKYLQFCLRVGHPEGSQLAEGSLDKHSDGIQVHTLPLLFQVRNGGHGLREIL